LHNAQTIFLPKLPMPSIRLILLLALGWWIWRSVFVSRAKGPPPAERQRPEALLPCRSCGVQVPIRVLAADGHCDRCRR
jgi:hypothetical protein